MPRRKRDPFNKLFGNVKQCGAFLKDGEWTISSKTNMDRWKGTGAWSGNWEPAKIYITKEDLKDIWYNKQGGKCFWFGIELDPEWIYEKRHPLALSVDRIDDDGDYSKDNVVICCRIANFGRNTYSFDGFQEVVRYMKSGILKENKNEGL